MASTPPQGGSAVQPRGHLPPAQSHVQHPKPQMPRHPIPSMQEAFAESLAEVTSGTLELKPKIRVYDAQTRRKLLIDEDKSDGPPAALWRYRPGQKCHELRKLLAQISFGVYLLLKGMANSNAQVVAILQGHIDEVDDYLRTAMEDLDLATEDLSSRLEYLQLPLSNLPTFEAMLQDATFRLRVTQGNITIEHILSRTSTFLLQVIQDLTEGLQSTKEFTAYLAGEENGSWRVEHPAVGNIFSAMCGNVDGWLNTFTNLQEKCHTVDLLMSDLSEKAAEMGRRATEAGNRFKADDQLYPSMGQPERLSQASYESRETTLDMPVSPGFHIAPSPPRLSLRFSTLDGSLSPGFFDLMSGDGSSASDSFFSPSRQSFSPSHPSVSIEPPKVEEHAKDEPTAKPADKPAKPAAKPADEPADKPADKPADEPEDKPADKPVDKPADELADKPVDEPADELADEPADELADEPAAIPMAIPVAIPMAVPVAIRVAKPDPMPAQAATVDTTADRDVSPVDVPSVDVSPVDDTLDSPSFGGYSRDSASIASDTDADLVPVPLRINVDSPGTPVPISNPEPKEDDDQEQPYFLQPRTYTPKPPAPLPSPRVLEPEMAPSPRVHEAELAPSPRVHEAELAPSPRVREAELMPSPRVREAELMPSPRVREAELMPSPRVRGAEMMPSPRMRQAEVIPSPVFHPEESVAERPRLFVPPVQERSSVHPLISPAFSGKAHMLELRPASSRSRTAEPAGAVRQLGLNSSQSSSSGRTTETAPRKRSSIRDRVSLRTTPPEAIQVPPPNAPPLQRPVFASPRTYENYQTFTGPDSAYSDADRIAARSFAEVPRSNVNSNGHEFSPPVFPGIIPSPHSEQQFFRPVQASPHSPLQQRPHTAGQVQSRSHHLRNAPSSMGMSMLSSVTTMTQDTNGRTVKKKRSAFDWLKKAFTLDEDERAEFDQRKKTQERNLYYDTRSPRYLDGRRIH